MKKPINEVERLKLIAGLINEVNYTDAVYGVNRKTTLTEAKKEKTLHIDVANPYEFRHGIQYELEQMDDYSDEALEKAKVKVLKNLAKDANFYFNLLNQQPTGFEFKAPETDAPGMQAKADGYLKKELKKDEKANVKDNLGKSEAAKGKPKDVKELTDKGVEGKEKVVKEGLEELKKKVINKYVTIEVEDDGEEYPMLNKKAIADYLKSVIDPSELKSVNYFMRDEEGFDESSSYFFDAPDADPKTTTEKEVEDWAKQEISYYLFSKPDEFPSKDNMEEGIESDPVNGDSSAEGQFNQLMSKYDWYYEMSDDPRKYDTGRSIDQKLKSLAKTIGVDKAVELFNASAPSDRKVTTTFFTEGEDKHAKIKETLKKGLKELMSAADIQAAKLTGKPVNVAKTNTQDIKALQTAKANYTTYE